MSASRARLGSTELSWPHPDIFITASVKCKAMAWPLTSLRPENRWTVDTQHVADSVHEFGVSRLAKPPLPLDCVPEGSRCAGGHGPCRADLMPKKCHCAVQ